MFEIFAFALLLPLDYPGDANAPHRRLIGLFWGGICEQLFFGGSKPFQRTTGYLATYEHWLRDIVLTFIQRLSNANAD